MQPSLVDKSVHGWNYEITRMCPTAHVFSRHWPAVSNCCLSAFLAIISTIRPHEETGNDVSKLSSSQPLDQIPRACPCFVLLQAKHSLPNTVTMAVAAPARPVHAVQGPLRSPTLSDAGMILPAHEASHIRSVSPNPTSQRPPSLPVLSTPTRDDSSHVRLVSPPQSRRRTSTQTRSPHIVSAQSSRSALRTMVDSEAAARRANSARDDALASSPTVQNGLNGHSPNHWSSQRQRRFSSTSSSVHSEDLDHWPGFDTHDSFDDSGLGLDDNEKRDHFPGDEMDSARWTNGRGGSGSSEDDDEYTSAALSRRAEIILANAKKRLNVGKPKGQVAIEKFTDNFSQVMEGNLRGARESLVVSPTFNGLRSASELSIHVNAARERDRKLYAGIGPIPPRMHSYRSSPLSPPSPGHSRGLSETSVPLPFSSPSYLTRTASNKRASSAIGHTSGPWAEGTRQGRFPIKESRSYEVMRDPRSTWATTEHDSQSQSQLQSQAQHQSQPQWPPRTSSRSSRSPPALETLPEDEDAPRVHRSASAASGLRDQVNELKGRISSLKLRAQEDHMRRQSMRSLRTPSPFTNAQEWYTGSDNYQAGGAPVTAAAGLGIKTESPTRRALFEEEEDRIIPAHMSQEENTTQQSHSESNAHYETNDQVPFDELEAYDDEEEVYETDEGDFVSVADEDYETGPDSVYEDAVNELPTTERHEDRVDAFDYEHFFLHSAMGTYSREGRRSSSVGSDSSTETTRPVTALQSHDTEKRISFHQRNSSDASVSTIASFATAAEIQEEEENEQMDQFSEQILAQQQQQQQQQSAPSRPLTSNSYTSIRSDSAINMRRGTGSSPTLLSPTLTSISRASSSADLASGLQVSKIYSILTESTSSSTPTREEPRLALSEEEKQLIYSVAAGLQQVCSRLRDKTSAQDERREYRRRLDEAQKILLGVQEEVDDDDQSF